MRNQEQPKESKWYNSIVVLLCIFLFYYLLFYLCVAKFGWLLDSNGDISTWSIIFVIIAPVLLFVSLLVYLYKENNRENKQRTCDMVFKSQRNASLLDERIETAIKAVDINDSVRSAIEESLKNTNLVNNAVKDGLQNSINDSRVMSEAIQTFVNKNLDTARIIKIVEVILKDQNTEKIIRNVIKKADVIETVVKSVVTKNNISRTIELAMKNESFLTKVRSAINSNMKEIKFNDGKLEDALKGAIKDKMDVLEVIETKRYNFAERVVEEICKIKNIQDTQINAIRDTIDDILHVSYVKLVSNESENKVVLLFSDVNSNHFSVIYNKTDKKIESAAPEGDYRMTNQIIIKIRNNAIDDISTTETH